MSIQREPAWSNDEKNYLLAEIIKSQSPHPSVLYAVVEQLNVQPHNVSWEDIPLPRERTIRSARSAFDEIRRHPRPFMPMTYGPQTPLSAPPMATKRPFPSLEVPYPSGREIRPKLAPSYPPAGTQQASVSDQPPKRKRGRPPKVPGTQIGLTTAGSSGERSAPPAPLSTRPQPHLSPSTPALAAPEPAPTEEAKTTVPPPARMPISAVLTPTAPKTTSQPSSSSGKRKRGKSTRFEAEGAGSGLGSGAAVAGRAYESPYGRADSGGLEDTPARAAVLRHREEPSTAPATSRP